MEYQNQTLMLIAVVAALVAYFFFFQKKEGLNNEPSAPPNDAVFQFYILMAAKYGPHHPSVKTMKGWIIRRIPMEQMDAFKRNIAEKESRYRTYFRSIGVKI
jgi:hypothetical protein